MKQCDPASNQFQLCVNCQTISSNHLLPVVYNSGGQARTPGDSKHLQVSSRSDYSLGSAAKKATSFSLKWRRFKGDFLHTLKAVPRFFHRNTPRIITAYLTSTALHFCRMSWPSHWGSGFYFILLFFLKQPAANVLSFTYLLVPANCLLTLQLCF